MNYDIVQKNVIYSCNHIIINKLHVVIIVMGASAIH